MWSSIILGEQLFNSTQMEYFDKLKGCCCLFFLAMWYRIFSEINISLLIFSKSNLETFIMCLACAKLQF